MRFLSPSEDNIVSLSSDLRAANMVVYTEDCVEVKPANALAQKDTLQQIVFAPKVSGLKNCTG